MKYISEILITAECMSLFIVSGSLSARGRVSRLTNSSTSKQLIVVF